MAIGDVCLKAPAGQDLAFAKVAFLNGMMACCKEDMLLHTIEESDCATCQEVHSNDSSLAGLTSQAPSHGDHHQQEDRQHSQGYHKSQRSQPCGKGDHISFHGDQKTIASWMFERIAMLCESQHQYHAFQLLLQWYNKLAHISNPYLYCSSPMVKATLGLVWTQLDSPVEGVNQATMQVFDLLLQALMSDPSYDSFVHDIMDDVMTMSWHVKGKHRLISVLITHQSIGKVCQIIFL